MSETQDDFNKLSEEDPPVQKVGKKKKKKEDSDEEEGSEKEENSKEEEESEKKEETGSEKSQKLVPKKAFPKKEDDEDPMLKHHNPEEGEEKGSDHDENEDEEENEEEDSFCGTDSEEDLDEYDIEKKKEREQEDEDEFIMDDSDDEEPEEESEEPDILYGDSDEESNESEESKEQKEHEKPEEFVQQPISQKVIQQAPEKYALEIEDNKFVGTEENQPLISKDIPVAAPIKLSRSLPKPQAMDVKPPEPKEPKLKVPEKQQPSFKAYDFGEDLKQTTKVPAGKSFILEESVGVCSQIGSFLKKCCKRKKQTAETTEVEKQFKNRVIVRYCCVVLIPLFLLAIFFGLYFFTKSDGKFSQEITKLTNINVNLTRCLLVLNENPQDSLIYGSYYVTFSLSAIFNETLEQSAALFNYDEIKDEYNISVTSIKENMKSCHLYLNIPSNLINNLRVECFDKCYITQEYHTIQLNSFEMTSDDDIYTNFRRIEANILNYTANRGILQLNSFKISEKAKIDMFYGDVILQSEEDIKLDWQNSQQTFCFASPAAINHDAISSCYIAGNDATKENAGNPKCQGQTNICLTENCAASMPSFTITQLYGNLYVNRLTAPFIDIEYEKLGYQILSGGIYEQGVAFEPTILAGIEEMKKKADEMKTDAIFIIQMGKKYLQSQSNSFWTVISNPSFAYLRPWWLATFSLSLLTANSYQLSGQLSPGICPYHIEANIYDINTVQNYLKDFFAINNSIISYIDESLEKDPDLYYKNGSGFYDFEKDRPITEKWLSIAVDQESKLTVVSNNISHNGMILAALILSFVFAAFVGGTVFMIFKAAVMITYKETWEKATHTRNYINFVKPKDEGDASKKKKKRINIKGILEESSFSNFMQEVPRLSAFVGYYSANLVKKYFIDSVAEFLGFLMNPYLESEYIKANKGIGEEKYMVMKERILKNNYEKFCFLNGLTEKQLSDSENLKKIEEYGYELIDEEENLSKVFTKMQLLEEIPDLDPNTLNNEDSLEIFINNCVKTTNAETDTEYIDEFTEKFNLFCDKYRLPRKEIRPDEMTSNIKYKFGLTILLRKKLVRKIKKEIDPTNKKDKPAFSFYEFFKVLGLKIVTFGRYVDKKSLQGKYLLDEDQLNYHFSILLKPEDQHLYQDFDKKFTDKDKNDKNKELIITRKEVINKMIYHSYWYYWIVMDVVMIFIQQLVTAACIMPFFFLVLLQEITYSPYSIIDPIYLITE